MALSGPAPRWEVGASALFQRRETGGGDIVEKVQPTSRMGTKVNTRRKILMGVLAIALPIGTIAAVQSTAFAAKVTGTGTTTCTFGGTINFNPPLTSAGTAGVKKEITTVTATLSACT